MEELKEKKKAAQKLTMRIIGVLTVIVIGYVVYALITKNVNMVLFEVLLAVFVISYLLLSDVVEPWKVGLLKELTPERKTAFRKILGLDVVGAAALLYWISGMNSEAGNNLLIPVVIYFLANQMKRKIRPEFEGTKEETEDEPTDPESRE